MTASSSGLPLSWLLRLRWITVVGQAAAILVAERLLEDQLRAAPLLGLVALGALSNLGLWAWLRRERPAPASLPGLVLGLDVLLLTGLLYGSGGAANPFTAIYLVHITLAAVVLRGLWAWALGLLSLAGFGLLFFFNVHVHALAHMDHGGGGVSLHLVGMWVAFAITAALIAAFVGRVNEALRQRDEEVAALRDLNARQARLAALTTLAAGVAHELGSPLGTIAVAAKEVLRGAEVLGGPGLGLAEDARLIRQEVDRCRGILDQMAGPAGSTLGEDLRELDWAGVERDLLGPLAPGDRARIQLLWPDARPMVPCRGLVRALRALVSNALEATPVPGAVTVTASREAEGWCLVVRDEGRGMPGAVLARAGEPFFTTKPEGKGMGLGLFLARTFAEQLGGGLEVESREGGGTRVRLRWPEGGRG